MIKEKLRDVTNKIWDRNRKKINKKYRSELKNKDFTIFSCNCTGGVLYHDLGMKFLSPTINLYMICRVMILLSSVKILKNTCHLK